MIVSSDDGRAPTPPLLFQCMALGQEHLRWIALPNGQLAEPRALARRPTRPHAQHTHRTLTVVIATRFFVRCRGRPRNVSASSPASGASTLQSLRVLDDASRPHSAVVYRTALCSTMTQIVMPPRVCALQEPVLSRSSTSLPAAALIRSTA